MSSPGYVAIELDNMGMVSVSRGESAVYGDDIVLIYDGSHYNALSWARQEHTSEAHEQYHFEDDFDDDVADS